MPTDAHLRGGPRTLLRRLRTLTLAVLLVLGATPALAAGLDDGGDWRDELLQGIVLTEAQRARLDSIQAVYAARLAIQRRAALGESSDGAPWALWLRLQREQRNAIRAALTPDQQRTFDANAEAARERMQAEVRRATPRSRWPLGIR